MQELPVDPLLLWYAVFGAGLLVLLLMVTMMLRQARSDRKTQTDETQEVERSGVQFPLGNLREDTEEIKPDQQNVA